MAAAASNLSTFPAFSSLPPELRTQIWRDALPDRDGPALCFYRKGSQYRRHRSISDEGNDAGRWHDLGLEFHHGLLDYVQVDVPLAFVNCESRDIALAWVREQGIEIRFREEKQLYVFVRPFDAAHDALYVALDTWDDFRDELYNISRPDLLERPIGSVAYFRRIAVPETLLRSKGDKLIELFSWRRGLAVLYVVPDTQLDLQIEDTDIDTQRRWELENIPGRAYFWDGRHIHFDVEESEYTGDEVLHKRREEPSKSLDEEYPDLEIWSAVAVRK